MPFGSPGASAFGTYFIGYSRHLWVTEKMIERMFIGDPPGLYDRILDFSEAVMGCTFFAPSADFLRGLADEPTPAPSGASASPDRPIPLETHPGLDDRRPRGRSARQRIEIPGCQ
jgi:putative iron-dependent peroxidase